MTSCVTSSRREPDHASHASSFGCRHLAAPRDKSAAGLRESTALEASTLSTVVRVLIPVSLAALIVAAGAAGAGPPPKPRIVAKWIPFTAARRAEMAAYSLRHYGTASWKLTSPHVIVEHFTANETFPGTWNTFASDTSDPELHELPGDCAHFVIDRDGTITSSSRSAPAAGTPSA